MTDLAERDAEILRLHGEGVARADIRTATGANKNVVDNVIGAAKRAGMLAPVRPQGAIALYEAMISAIAAAKAVDEAKDISDRAEAMRVYARQAKNKDAEIDAAEIRIRAERRIGELIAAAKDIGQVSVGQPPKNGAQEEPFSRVTLAEAGIDKKLSVRAQKLAKLPADEFAWQLSGWREKATEEGARVTVRLLKGDQQKTKAEARAVKEELLGRTILQLPDKRYGVILADPPWRFEPYSRETGMDRAADNHYPTLADIPSMADIAAIAADNSALFLWTTVPMLPLGLSTMKGWGFDYRSHFIWAKDRIGTGYWNRNRHELLLVGVKGNIPAPAMGTQWESLIEAPVGKHSEKPEKFLELIEAYFPTLPKIELNRRGPARPGWDAWGNEVEESRSESEAGQTPEHGETAAGSGFVSRAVEGATAGVPLSPALPAAAQPEDHRDPPAVLSPAPPPKARYPEEKIDFEIPAFLRRQAAAA